MSMTSVALIFPNQLFKNHPVLREKPEKVLLIEHTLFFGDARYPMRMHKQKLAYHRATMSVYKSVLEKKGFLAELIAWQSMEDPLHDIVKAVKSEGFDEIFLSDVHDDILTRRVEMACQENQISLRWLDTPGFINSSAENQHWRSGRKRWFMADYYQWQRRRLDILMFDDKPVGGQWSFDEDNRRKLPKKLFSAIPKLPNVKITPAIQAAIQSVEADFPDNPGNLDSWIYPITFESAERWLERFLTERLHNFGHYEDAIVENEMSLYHSVLTPMLNIGLLTPLQIVERALSYAEKNEIPINSLEGFVRQIIGWREFMRATYEDLGPKMRTTNHWNHNRPMPDAFYTATTGIDPVDNVVRQVNSTGYCHHIERLMILGGFMFLCEIEPDDIYRWFMEMFVDSYDWVMVPNAYAMSQHADGGSITTKPYFSGSNYVIKMSHYKKGEWSEVWDALFWRWIFKHGEALRSNPRWAMMVRNAERMDDAKRARHLEVAERFLESLDQ